jgi:hypothetical protein
MQANQATWDSITPSRKNPGQVRISTAIQSPRALWLRQDIFSVAMILCLSMQWIKSCNFGLTLAFPDFLSTFPLLFETKLQPNLAIRNAKAHRDHWTGEFYCIYFVFSRFSFLLSY